MSFFNKIFSSCTYYYFDENQKLTEKTLSPLQKIWRNVFGYYQETHLNNVAKKTYLLILSDKAPRDQVSKCRIFTLLSKIKSAADISLFDFTLPSGRQVKIKPDFKLTPKEQKFSEIGFEFEFKGGWLKDFEYTSSLYQMSHSPSFRTTFLRNFIRQDLFDSKTAIELGTVALSLNDSRTINSIWAKILMDTASLDAISSSPFQDYESIADFNFTSNKKEKNIALDNVIREVYGWELENVERDKYNVPRNRFYVFVKNSDSVQNKAIAMDPLFKNGRLSLDFALRHLKVT